MVENINYRAVTVGALVAFLIGVLFGVLFAGWQASRKAATVAVSVQECITAMQKRTGELEKDYADMLRDATQFHDELEACQREKGVEWRERMQAVCSGYTTEREQKALRAEQAFKDLTKEMP
jgi:hypothetical protein